jgi:DNA repair protein RadC
MHYTNPENRLSIKAWAEDDRPREKLLLKGRHVLSDAELLAILIGSGNRNESAVDLCKRILGDYENNLDILARCSVSDLRRYRGMGEAKAISIIAAMELGRRRSITPAQEVQPVSSSEAAYKIIAPLLTDLNHEEFWVLLLNRANIVMRKELISKGGMNATVVDPKLIFRAALDYGASGMILCHNHPSGSVKPSEQDRKLTRRLSEGAAILDISLLDHIIVGSKTFFSFADEGLM